jgi:uncharacterized protein YjbJ (UPF0337 family)
MAFDGPTDETVHGFASEASRAHYVSHPPVTADVRGTQNALTRHRSERGAHIAFESIAAVALIHTGRIYMPDHKNPIDSGAARKGDADSIAGQTKEAFGKATEKLGTKTDDPQREAEGKFQKEQGKAQDKLGKSEQKLERDR